MNLSRAFAGVLSSSKSKKWLLLRPIAALQSSPLSTEAAPQKRIYKKKTEPSPSKPEPEHLGLYDAASKQKKLAEPPRPSEIPFQIKVANSVNLIGFIGVPVQLQASRDGTYSAISVLVQEKTPEFPQFWIPVIFQGDLAQIAACHLRENDLVYVTGQLSGDAPPIIINDAQTNVQVLAHSLSFVEEVRPKKEGHMVHKQVSDCAAKTEESQSAFPLWNDLLANPAKWWDNRSDKTKPKSAAFRHKDSGQLLWINESTPEWVLSKLDTLAFHQNTTKKSQKIGNVKKACGSGEISWNAFVLNPHQWLDNRMDKLNKLVKPNYPDFKHKDTHEGLWLTSAPEWVLSKLDGLEFGGSNHIPKERKDGNAVPIKKYEKAEMEESRTALHLWNDLLANPYKWWDNRSDKSKPTSAAFRHKDSGQLLWLNESTPEWVLSKLDTLAFHQKTTNKSQKFGNVKEAGGSVETSWNDLVLNPHQWWDKRMDKLKKLVKPNYPDFKHKDNNQVLWLNCAPEWVLSKLDGLAFGVNNHMPKEKKDGNVVPIKRNGKEEDSWKDLVENPNEWWDNRSNKLSPKSPDFTNKETRIGLWLSSSPSWVLSKLPPQKNQGKGLNTHKRETLLS